MCPLKSKLIVVLVAVIAFGPRSGLSDMCFIPSDEMAAEKADFLVKLTYEDLTNLVSTKVVFGDVPDGLQLEEHYFKEVPSRHYVSESNFECFVFLNYSHGELDVYTTRSIVSNTVVTTDDERMRWGYCQPFTNSTIIPRDLEAYTLTISALSATNRYARQTSLESALQELQNEDLYKTNYMRVHDLVELFYDVHADDYSILNQMNKFVMRYQGGSQSKVRSIFMQEFMNVNYTNGLESVRLEATRSKLDRNNEFSRQDAISILGRWGEAQDIELIQNQIERTITNRVSSNQRRSFKSLAQLVKKYYRPESKDWQDIRSWLERLIYEPTRKEKDGYVDYFALEGLFQLTEKSHPYDSQAAKDLFDKYSLTNINKLVVFYQPNSYNWKTYLVALFELIESNASRYTVEMVNIDTHKELREAYRIQYIPAYVLIRDGQVVFKREGSSGMGSYSLERLFEDFK